MLIFQWLLWALVIFCTVDGYKILVYNPQLGRSHVQFWGCIADILKEAGHDVTVLVPRYNDLINVTGTKLSRTIIRPRDFEISLDENMRMSDVWTSKAGNLQQIIKTFKFFFESQYNLCNALTADEKLLSQLRNEKFDLGIVEMFNSCGFVLFDKIGIPAYITGYATNLIEQTTDPFGLDNNPSFVSGALSIRSDEMTYFERVKNLLSLIVSRQLMHIFVPLEDFYRRLVPGFDLPTAVSQSAFVFVNSDEFLEFPRPVNHKIVYVGGAAVSKPKPLSKDFTQLLSKVNRPVVLLSFGTIASSSKMPTHIRDAFLQMFANLPEATFLWKYEVDDDIASNLTNVFKQKWLPQNDLLNHPKIRAFISHCGLNSVTESVHAAVPIVCVPLFSDQMRNAKMVEKKGVSIFIDKDDISGKVLTKALYDILHNERYTKEATRLAEMIHNKPVSALDRVVKYAEFAARFKKTDNLLPSSVRLNFFQYYLLDIIIPFLIIALAILYSIVVILLSMFRYFASKMKIKKE